MTKLNILGATFTILLLCALVIVDRLLLMRMHREILDCYKEQTKDTIHVDTN